MPKKKRKKKRIIRQEGTGQIFVSPDNGETVYVQNLDGTRGKMISQSNLAKDVETAQKEMEMHGVYAIQMRKKYPALQNSWQKYKTIWHLIHDDN